MPRALPFSGMGITRFTQAVLATLACIGVMALLSRVCGGACRGGTPMGMMFAGGLIAAMASGTAFFVVKTRAFRVRGPVTQGARFLSWSVKALTGTTLLGLGALLPGFVMTEVAARQSTDLRPATLVFLVVGAALSGLLWPPPEAGE